MCNPGFSCVDCKIGWLCRHWTTWLEFPLLVAVIVALIGWMGAPLTPCSAGYDPSMPFCLRPAVSTESWHGLRQRSCVYYLYLQAIALAKTPTAYCPLMTLYVYGAVLGVICCLRMLTLCPVQNLELGDLAERVRAAVVAHAQSLMQQQGSLDAHPPYIVLDLPCTFFMLATHR